MKYILDDGTQKIEIKADNYTQALEKVLGWNGMTIEEEQE